MAEATIYLKEMKCGHCAKEAIDALGAVEGVSEISVSIGKSLVKVVYDESRADMGRLTEAINTAGFATE